MRKYKKYGKNEYKIVLLRLIGIVVGALLLGVVGLSSILGVRFIKNMYEAKKLEKLAPGVEDRYVCIREDLGYDIIQYKYDNYGRIVNEKHDSNSAWYEYTYCYDTKGNKIEEIYSDSNFYKETFFEYDENGLLISSSGDEQAEYTYDEDKRLVQKVDEYKTTNYVYDENGVLIEESNSMGQSTKYQYK